METDAILKEISHKLDLLIVLMKLSNRKTIEDFKRELKKDRISSRILEVSDGTLTYSDISKKVAQEINAAEITVKKKISSLKEMGLLVTRREGREVFYESSGLID